jgi:signal transduction histidine kinase
MSLTQPFEKHSVEVCDLLPIGMVRFDGRGTATYMNGACHELLASMELRPDALPRILPKRHRSVLRRALTEGITEEVMSLYNGRALRLVFRPSEDRSSTYLFIIDLTDQEEAKAQLLQSEKMASLGLLVAGLAHEINTPLGAIHSNNDTMTKSMARIRELLNTIDAAHLNETTQSLLRIMDIVEDLCRNTAIAAERLIGISSSLKDFTRRDEPESQKVDLHEGLDKTLTIVQHKLKGRIRVEKHYGALPLVECHPNRINQVFMNLLVNAAQAIPDNGTITITTSRENDSVTIVIADDGVGIADENISKVFDPGFTTKGVGIGTGLGLSICYKIVQEHRGRIDVESGKNGTTFTLVLPIKQPQKVSHERK